MFGKLSTYFAELQTTKVKLIKVSSEGDLVQRGTVNQNMKCWEQRKNQHWAEQDGGGACKTKLKNRRWSINEEKEEKKPRKHKKNKDEENDDEEETKK